MFMIFEFNFQFCEMKSSYIITLIFLKVSYRIWTSKGLQIWSILKNQILIHVPRAGAVNNFYKKLTSNYKIN